MKSYINHIKREPFYVLISLSLIIMLSLVYAQYVSVGSAWSQRVIKEEFTVSIVLPSSIQDLYAWQAVVTFNPNVVTVLEVNNGKVLSSHTLMVNSESLSTVMNGSRQLSDGDSVFVISYSDIELGKLTLAETKLGDVSGVSAIGALVTIKFGVFGHGSYDIKLQDATLLDSNLNQIQQIFLTSPAEIS